MREQASKLGEIFRGFIKSSQALVNALHVYFNIVLGKSHALQLLVHLIAQLTI